MDKSRGVGSQRQGELKNTLNFEEYGANVILIERGPPKEEIPVISISIVSNSRLLSEGLPTLLSPYLSLRLMGTYSGDFHMSSLLPNPHGHVVLLDSSVGQTLAVTWTRHWRGLIPAAYVLVLELANDNALILACIEAGANGYTLEGAAAVEVATAIKDVRCGVAHCSPEVTAQLYARVAALSATVIQLSVSPLTARESEILGYIGAGYTNLEISTHLVIELRTVKQHVHHILGKLNARSRGEAVRLAAAQGWLGRDLEMPLKRD